MVYCTNRKQITMTNTKISELEKLEELILEYKNESDVKKKHVAYLRLIEETLKLVKKIVLSFYPFPGNISRDDLIQVGAVGVLKAIETYKDKVTILKMPKKGGIGLNESLSAMCEYAKMLVDKKDTAEFLEKHAY